MLTTQLRLNGKIQVIYKLGHKIKLVCGHQWHKAGAKPLSTVIIVTRLLHQLTALWGGSFNIVI